MAAATHTYIDPANAGDVNPIEGVTVVVLTADNHSLSLTTDNQTSPAFILIDTSGVTSNADPNISINGNSAFQGIIWIIGQAKLNGTTDINGAVFVECGSTVETKLTGDATLIYDANAIGDAIDAVGGALGSGSEVGVPHLISYKEI
jgi:hypothetical protein